MPDAVEGRAYAVDSTSSQFIISYLLYSICICRYDVLVVAFQGRDVQFIRLDADDWAVFLVQVWETFDEAGSEEVVVGIV